MKLYAVMNTSTNGMENYVPHAVMTIDSEKVRERIAIVKESVERTGAASLSFWDDDVVMVDWIKELPKEWLDENGLDLLERTGLTYTSKKPPEELYLERVDASMTVFWDASLCVRCDDCYAENDIWYEGPMIVYSDLLDLLQSFERET